MSEEDPNIQIALTDISVPHCFKLVLQVRVRPDSEERAPMEILLHTTQAIDLFSKLAARLSEYFQKASAELLEIRTRQIITDLNPPRDS